MQGLASVASARTIGLRERSDPALTYPEACVTTHGDEPGRQTQPEPDPGDADDARRTAHELVAQAQALLHIASQRNVLPFWWPRGVPDVSPTFPELALKAGLAHAEIASGHHDGDLAARVGNSLGRPKRQLLRRLLVQVQDVMGREAVEGAAKWIKTACGVASSALGSMSFIPGVGAIQEAIDLVRTGLETVEQLGASGDLGDKPSGKR